jgi:hypothetical protein
MTGFLSEALPSIVFSITYNGLFDRPAVEAGEKVTKKPMIGQAQAQALRQARTGQTYSRFGLTWREFCPKRPRVSGTQADETLRVEGAVPEPNSAKVRKAARSVRDSQRALPPPAAPAPEEPAALPIPSGRLNALYRGASEVAAEFRGTARDSRGAEPPPVFRGTPIRVRARERRGVAGAAFTVAGTHLGRR